MAIHGKNRDKITEAIRARRDFRIANMSGTRIGSRYPVQGGELNHHPAERARLDTGIDRGEITYVIYSFATPIGWVEDGAGYVPDVRYTITTTHHQNVARVALDV
jgi:hypothetical protein